MPLMNPNMMLPTLPTVTATSSNITSPARMIRIECSTKVSRTGNGNRKLVEGANHAVRRGIGNATMSNLVKQIHSHEGVPHTPGGTVADPKGRKATQNHGNRPSKSILIEFMNKFTIDAIPLSWLRPSNTPKTPTSFRRLPIGT
jgi:hypothetical protein